MRARRHIILLALLAAIAAAGLAACGGGDTAEDPYMVHGIDTRDPAAVLVAYFRSGEAGNCDGAAALATQVLADEINGRTEPCESSDDPADYSAKVIEMGDETAIVGLHKLGDPTCTGTKWEMHQTAEGWRVDRGVEHGLC